MRAIWTGSLGFGLVNIPVKLYSAVEDSTLDLDMLDKKDHAHIKFMRVNEKTGKEVKWENIVKGYDLDGKYVILSDEDFQKASPEKTKHIEILQFVNQEEVDSMYYESPYYLAPEKTGTKAYALLRDALQKAGKAGLGTYVLRNKENIGLIKVSGDALVLNKMRFGEEIRSTEELKLPEANPKAAELKMAMALIDQLTEKFDISKYHDTYSEELMKLIKAKAKGKTVTPAPLKVVHSKSKDLMSQLKASLEGGKKRAS
jgi:DNA end-binding protein Ku